MRMDAMLLDMEDNLNNFNNVRDIVLKQLVKDGIITDEQMTNYSEKWNVIIVKPSWFKRWKSKFSGDNNDYIIKYVRFED